MKWSFTAAAERVLAESATWTTEGEQGALQPHHLLIGLLGEPECRAAAMLASRGIDAEKVRARWPLLVRSAADAAKRDYSPAVSDAVQAAADRLWEYPSPLTLATEHLLLGLVATPSEVSAWLAEHGFDADALEQHIHQLYGHVPGALTVDLEPSLDAAQLRTIVAATDAAPWRALDASANRAREGLRVVEDYMRFVLDDAQLTSQLKQLRHDLASLVAKFPQPEILASRDTTADVGTTIRTETEFIRADVAEVAAANWKRCAEAIRSLEEFSKTFDPALAVEFERLRYRAYTVESACAATRDGLDRLAGVRLCVLIDARSSEHEMDRLVSDILDGGARLIQFREKGLSDRELLARARRLRERTRAADAMLIVNDRADIAAAVHADGVHLGQDDLTISAARRILGGRALVGVSTHSIEQARQAVIDGANYIGVGPTFPSATKSFNTFTGIDLLCAVAAEIRLPAFAIGGISAENIDSVLATGIDRVAVSAAIVAAHDPASATKGILERMK